MTSDTGISAEQDIRRDDAAKFARNNVATIAELLATDRGSLADIPAWAEENGDELLSSGEDGGVFTFLVRKAVGE